MRTQARGQAQEPAHRQAVLAQAHRLVVAHVEGAPVQPLVEDHRRQQRRQVLGENVGEHRFPAAQHGQQAPAGRLQDVQAVRVVPPPHRRQPQDRPGQRRLRARPARRPACSPRSARPGRQGRLLVGGLLPRRHRAHGGLGGGEQQVAHPRPVAAPAPPAAPPCRRGWRGRSARGSEARTRPARCTTASRSSRAPGEAGGVGEIDPAAGDALQERQGPASRRLRATSSRLPACSGAPR